MSTGYLKRPRFFAHRYSRLLTKTCAAQDIGHIAFVLCVTIAHQEDAKRYRGAVTFFNEQLMPLIGVTKWRSLDRARKRAVEAGWLHFEPGNKGKRQPGRYWVTIPDGLDKLDDSPCDETQYAPKGEWLESQYAPKGQCGGQRRGQLSSLTLNPKKSQKLRFSDDDREIAQWIFEQLLKLNPGHTKPNLNSWANVIRLMRERDGRTLEQIRGLFAWANADKFWHKNILSPATLRKQWDRLTIERKNGNGRSRNRSGDPVRSDSPARIR